jgi:hypothetical protein
MPRNLSPAFASALDADILVPALAAHFDFDGDPLHAWSGLGDLTLGLDTYIGLEGAFAVEPLKETSDARIVSVKCQLGYVPSGSLPDLETTEWQARSATIYLVVLDPTTLAVVDYIEMFRGDMDTLSVDVGEAFSTISLTSVNGLVRLKQSWGGVYSLADSQQSGFPSDTGMRFLPAIQNRKIQL